MMKMTTLTTTRYEITESCGQTEIGAVTQYGIAGFDENGQEILRVDSITCDKASLEELIECCNKGKLSYLHIRDVVQDFIIGKE